MTQIILHQVLEAALVGDATTDHAFLIQRWLRQLGFRSDIFALHCHPSLQQSIQNASSLRISGRTPYLIYHHAIGSDVADMLISLNHPLILIYHNVTPPVFFANSEPSTARQLSRGLEQLIQLRKLTGLALADSNYSALELEEIGFSMSAVLPIVLDESLYKHAPDERVAALLRQRGPNLLFVGRLAPNKRQDDLIKLLHYYRRIQPEARLLLVGSPSPHAYGKWLREFASSLELENDVIFTNHVSQAELVAYYQNADVFVSMSEHEGFGKPLIESMYFNLPVAAYNAAAVPYTMGCAGLLFKHKHYESLAEIIDLIMHDADLRQVLVAGQNLRALDFLEEKVRALFENHLKELGLPL